MVSIFFYFLRKYLEFWNTIKRLLHHFTVINKTLFGVYSDLRKRILLHVITLIEWIGICFFTRNSICDFYKTFAHLLTASPIEVVIALIYKRICPCSICTRCHVLLVNAGARLGNCCRISNCLINRVDVCVGIVDGSHHVIRLQIGISRFSYVYSLTVIIFHRSPLLVPFTISMVFKRPSAYFIGRRL